MKILNKILLLTTGFTLILYSCKKEASKPDINVASASGYVYDEEKANLVDLAPNISTGTLPSVVDLSKDMPPVGYQGSSGSCVGWAVGYYVKSYQEKIEKNYNYLGGSSGLNFSNVISPAYIYNKIIVNPSICTSGSKIPDALSLLLNEGASTWEHMPYNQNECVRTPSQNAITNAALNKIKSYYKINFSVSSGYDVAKQYLNAGIPIIIGCTIDKDFEDGKKGSNGEFIWKSNFNVFDKKPGHALAIVGYDDDLQAFKIINSWGIGWGNNGFGYIKYDWLDDVYYEAYVMIDLKTAVSTQPKIRITGNNSSDVKVGQSLDFTLNIFNDGNKDLIISDIEMSNNSGNIYSFPNGKPSLPLNIQSGKKADFNLRFSPISVQTYNSVLTITSNSTSGDNTFNLSYKGTSSTTNSSIIRLGVGNCPDTKIGQSNLFPLTIYNDGNTPLFISGISSSNSAFSTQNFSSKTINANSSEVFNLIFSPIQVQLYSTQISVQSNASSGTNSISLNANGTSNSSSGIKIQPNLGNYTPCNNSNSTRDLTNYNKWLYTDYITNQFKFKVESIDSAKGVVSFVVKQCDNNNFKKYYTIVIYESDPINSPPIYQAKPNDADATISLNTKFQGHDTKTYVAIITDSSLGGNYYCTQDISISW